VQWSAGTHDLVMGIVRGRFDPQDEVWCVDLMVHSSLSRLGWVLCLGVTPASATVLHVAENSIVPSMANTH
jgi:aminoglycoside N3'-acetyltransferase